MLSRDNFKFLEHSVWYNSHVLVPLTNQPRLWKMFSTTTVI